jgi:hypothetical protein
MSAWSALQETTKEKLLMQRKLFGLLAALVVFSLVLAMAASLGGITGGALGADSASMASCDSDGVSTTYGTSYDAAAGEYVVSSVTVGVIANACDGKAIGVTLTDSSGAELGSGSSTIPVNVGSTSVSLSLSTTASAEAAENVHVVIS